MDRPRRKGAQPHCSERRVGGELTVLGDVDAIDTVSGGGTAGRCYVEEAAPP
jgi:hypothetical protein